MGEALLGLLEKRLEAGFQYPYRRIELLTLHLHTTQARLCYLLAFIHYNMEICPCALCHAEYPRLFKGEREGQVTELALKALQELPSHLTRGSW